MIAPYCQLARHKLQRVHGKWGSEVSLVVYRPFIAQQNTVADLSAFHGEPTKMFFGYGELSVLKDILDTDLGTPKVTGREPPAHMALK